MSNAPKLKQTKDYSLFSISNTNRGINPRHLRKMKKSMQEYGWIPAFPMLVRPTANGLEVVDGQHRLTVAKELGLAAWYVEAEGEFDAASINEPAMSWKIEDYCHCFTTDGKDAYIEVSEFSEKHGVSVGDAASLLGGQAGFSNLHAEFKAGTFTVKDREHAEDVAMLYNGIRAVTRMKIDKSLRLAVIAVARVPGVDLSRLIKNAERHPERFIKFATRDGALQMLEDVYNSHARGDKYPLRVNAENAMRDRNAAKAKR